jgi:transcriptional regulator with XRE-family HTH domain
MGTARQKPVKLGDKLLSIRKSFNYSLSQMATSLSDDEAKIRRQDVSRFEKGEREPSLIILLRYAQLVSISTDVLIDDKIEFPET